MRSTGLQSFLFNWLPTTLRCLCLISFSFVRALISKRLHFFNLLIFKRRLVSFQLHLLYAFLLNLFASLVDNFLFFFMLFLLSQLLLLQFSTKYLLLVKFFLFRHEILGVLLYLLFNFSILSMLNLLILDLLLLILFLSAFFLILHLLPFILINFLHFFDLLFYHFAYRCLHHISNLRYNGLLSTVSLLWLFQCGLNPLG